MFVYIYIYTWSRIAVLGLPAPLFLGKQDKL